MPIHVLYLALYWRFAREAGVAVSLAQKIDDALWTALLLGLIWLFNFYSDVEIAGAAPTALLLALRFWRDERPDRARLVAALQRQRALCRAHRWRSAPRGWCRRCAIS